MCQALEKSIKSQKFRFIYIYIYKSVQKSTYAIRGKERNCDGELKNTRTSST